MDIYLYIKNTLWFVLEYVMFLRDEIFSKKYKNKYLPKTSTLNFGNTIKRKTGLVNSNSLGDTSLKTYQNDYKPRSPGDGAEVRNPIII